MKKLIFVLLIGIGGYLYLRNNPYIISLAKKESTKSDQSISNAYQNQLSETQVIGSGKVSHVLSDDSQGSRHQRFILRLPSGQTVLIAHNIDIAPKIEMLREGDEVAFYGEYMWNQKGGLVHWTHHDPDGRHIGGWLKHGGHKYE